MFQCRILQSDLFISIQFLKNKLHNFHSEFNATLGLSIVIADQISLNLLKGSLYRPID